MGKPHVSKPWFVEQPRLLDQLRSDLAAKYPALHAYPNEDRVLVQGSYAVQHEGAELDWYLIEVELPRNYPQFLPRTKEIGGRIARCVDRHINLDGSLCLGVPEELWLKFAGKFDIVSYLEGPVRTFLISNSLVELGHSWPHGERSHGAAGIFEYYKETLGFDAAQTRQLLEHLAKGVLKGHWACPCGSGQVVRRCHLTQIRELQARVPVEVFKHSLTVIQSQLQSTP
jgi:hypothetical protein